VSSKQGFRWATRSEANLQALDDFLSESFVVVLDVTWQVSRH
jgi:hypothetical protein